MLHWVWCCLVMVDSCISAFLLGGLVLSASCCACCLFVASFPWCCMVAMDAQRWEQVELSVSIMVCNGASFASIMSSACLGTGVVMWWSCTTKVDFADLVMSLTGQYWHYTSTALAHSGAVWRLSLQFFFRLCDLLRFTPNCLWQQNLAASRFCTGMVSQHAWQRLESRAICGNFYGGLCQGSRPTSGKQYAVDSVLVNCGLLWLGLTPNGDGNCYESDQCGCWQPKCYELGGPAAELQLDITLLHC